MSTEYITIQEAADLSKKSVQTIRRAIKARKLKHRKKSTPQGFNYSIEKESLCSLYGIRIEKNEETQVPKESVSKDVKQKKVKKIEGTESEESFHVSKDDFHSFARTMEKMIAQHAEERQNFLRLVNTLQEKIFVLENQMNLLKSPEKKWFHFWK